MTRTLSACTLLCLLAFGLPAQDFTQAPCESAVVSGGGAASTIVFKNNSKESLQYYWIDFEGKAKYFGKIAALGTLEQPTYIGQYFMVADQNQNCWGKFAPLKAGKVFIPIEKPKGSAPYLPYNAAAQGSEQLKPHAAAPQVVGHYQNQQLFFAWNDGESEKVQLSAYTKKGNAFEKQWIREVPNGLRLLAGFGSDGTHLYCLSAIQENLSNDKKTLGYRPKTLHLSKTTLNGQEVWTRDLNSQAYFKSPVFSPLDFGTADLAIGGGRLLLMYAGHTLPDANGWRHQGANYTVIDTQNGQSGKDQNGTTSWRHSFDQRVLFDGKDFVLLDLADAGWYMPAAGITVNKVSINNQQVKIPSNPEGIYVYARQGETAGSQNFSFISMGDITTGNEGYTVLFSAEKSNPNRKREGWSEPILEPRNVGIVHVVKDFDKVKDSYMTAWGKESPKEGNTYVNYEKSIISLINITSNIVDTRKKNPKAEAGGATFSRPDKPNLQFKTASVAWLTNFTGQQRFNSAERPKLIKLNAQQYLALWEEWLVEVPSKGKANATYQSTQAMLVDEYGNVLREKRTVAARLNPNGADKLFLIEGKAAWLISENNQWKLCTLDANLQLERFDLAF
jgi:hypothetical protein